MIQRVVGNETGLMKGESRKDIFDPWIHGGTKTDDLLVHQKHNNQLQQGQTQNMEFTPSFSVGLGNCNFSGSHGSITKFANQPSGNCVNVTQLAGRSSYDDQRHSFYWVTSAGITNSCFVTYLSQTMGIDGGLPYSNKSIIGCVSCMIQRASSRVVCIVWSKVYHGVTGVLGPVCE